jgi:hypothetical protein
MGQKIVFSFRILPLLTRYEVRVVRYEWYGTSGTVRVVRYEWYGLFVSHESEILILKYLFSICFTVQ